jgi:hypothetical protein
MNSIIVFWNAFDYDHSNPDSFFLKIGNINNVVNVITDDRIFYKTTDSSVFVMKELIYDLPFDNSAPVDIRKKMISHETTIFKVIHRNFKGSGKKYNFDSIMKYYVTSLSHIHRTVSTMKINCSLFFDTPHHPYDYIAFLYFRELGINTFVSNYTPSNHSGNFNARRFITSSYPYLDENFFNYYNESLGKIDPIKDIPPDLYTFVEEYSGNSRLVYDRAHLGGKWSSKYLLKYFVKRFLYHISKLNFSKIIFKGSIYLYKISIDNFQRKSLLNYYSSNSGKPDYNEGYIYFPLHFQPEATTIPLGNEFSDQELAINYILDISNDNQIVYVREHPAFWHRISSTDLITDARSIEFYKRLVDNPKIRLISHLEDHKTLIQNSDAVVTITGTVAFEALGMNKLVFMFGNYIYSDLANVIEAPSIECEKILKNEGLYNYDFTNEFYSTLMALSKVSFPTSKSIRPTLGLSESIKSELIFICDYISNNLNRI